MKIWMEHLELDYEADIWWFCSTSLHEYYKTTKYELPTPTLSAPPTYVYVLGVCTLLIKRGLKGLLPGYITMFDKTIQTEPKHISGGVLRYSIAQNVCVK